jgi:anaerobic magnesium-protoporphyrin IX monomethyl ester cyclase
MKLAFVYPNNDRMVNRGAGYVATMARQAGCSLDFFDTAYIPPEKVVRQIVQGDYDLVLMSASSMLYSQAKDIAFRVKMGRTIPILLGGIHATIEQAKVLRDCKAVDYLCIGEGEEFIMDFLANYPDVQHLANLGYRNSQGEVIINPLRPITRLDTLPPFDYTLFQQESIVRSGPKPGFTYVFATRGCPYRCTYCCNEVYLNLYGKNYLRQQRLNTILEELILLRDRHGARFLYFGDEMLLHNLQFVKELFHRVKEEVGLPFGCMTRVETITPETVDLFKDTGCCYVSLGIECGDENFRREWLNRRMSNQRIIDAFSLLRTLPDMFIYAFYMHGFPVPYDDRLTEATKTLNEQLRPDLIQDTVFYPLPGTKLYEYCTEKDLIDWDKVNQTQNYLRSSVLKMEAVHEC